MRISCQFRREIVPWHRAIRFQHQRWFLFSQCYFFCSHPLKAAAFFSSSTIPSDSKKPSSDLELETEQTWQSNVNSTSESCSGIGKSGIAEFSASVIPSIPKIPGSDLRRTSVAKSCAGIGKSVIDKCSYIWEKKGDTFTAKSSLQDVLKLGFSLSPETQRRFWRAVELKPEEFLEILMGSEPEVVNLRKAGFLWDLFRWTSWQSREFEHLPRSKEMMMSMLADARMLEEAELLLLSLDHNIVLSNANAVFSQIIQGYSEAGKLEKSLSLYDRARDEGLIPSASCYRALLDLLIRKLKDEPVLRVYLDMVEAGLGSHSEQHVLDFVVAALIKNHRFVEALNMIRRVRSCGAEVGKRALSTIAEEFCRKKDFGDMMNFLEEWRHVPKARICNRMFSSLCATLGTEEAWLFARRLEALGFALDAITLGIFLFHSCKERKLRDAFLYLSECFSRCIEPKVCVYNALISGIFKEGLYRHAKYVFEDMVERKVMPDVSTYKILLAGYCKYRKFDEVEQLLNDMSTSSEIDLPSGDCVLSKALSFLRLDHLEVKIKRDNGIGLPKAEFFDSVGNGLYLETDSKKFDISLIEILDNAMVPDFSTDLITACKQGNIRGALQMKDETIQWCQNISLATYSELLKALCASAANITDLVDLIEEMPEMCDQLDSETLNLLVQTLSKNGMSAPARSVLEKLFQRGLVVQRDTYTDLMKGFCREKNIVGFQECWNLAKKCGWSPSSKDIMFLVSSLCKWGVIKEALEFLDTLVDCHPGLFFSANGMLLKEVCKTGYTCVGCAMVEALLEKGLVLDHSLFWYLMEGFLKEQKTAEALGMYSIWLEKSTIANAAAYQLILPLLLRFDVEKAMCLVESMQNKQFAGTSIHSSIVKKFGRIGKIKQAALVLQQMIVNKMLDGTLLNFLLEGYCCVNNLKRALEILCIMLRMHAKISIPAYRCLVHQMCERNQFLSALRLKELIQESDKSSELILYNILIFNLFCRGNNLLVNNILKDMQDRAITPDKITYDFLVYGFHKCGDIHRSVDMLNTAIARGLTPSNRSLRIVIRHYCSAGNLEKALELCHLIERSGWKHCSVIEKTVALCLLSFGRHLEAKLFVDAMSKRVNIGSDFDYDILIEQFCIKWDVRMAVELLNTMLKKGNLPSEVSYSSVIHILCTSKAFDQALDFLAEMQFMNLKPSEQSCDALIRGLCAVGRVDDAKRILEMMTQFGSVPTYDMYNQVMDKYRASNNLQKAAALLHEMQQAGYTPNFETQWSVISNLRTSDAKTEGDGKRILSQLLSWSGLQGKNSKVKGSSALKYNPR